MLEVVKERIREREKLLEKAREYAKVLRKRFGRVSVLVYGSVARGDFNRWSDVDVIVIAEKMPSDILERQEALLELAGSRIEPRGYSPFEFLHLLRKGHPFLKILKKEGIVVCDDFKLFEKLDSQTTHPSIHAKPIFKP